ncbi:MAG TPA: GNAT family protein [Desulfomonilaceae bacterium]|nr:GNAT family protein [Desulfomonilaceae bacterium]
MLENYPKEITSTDGTALVLRPLVKEDEQSLIEFFSRIPEEERWFLRDNMEDPEVVQQWVQNLDYEKILPLVAVKQADNTIIANVRLHRRPAECLRHVAHLRIRVDPQYRHQRLGTWMLLDTIKLAMSVGIEKLIAEFVEGVEQPAMNAARKLDFVEQAVLKEYVKDRQGRYRSLIIMVKSLYREWGDF